MTSKQTRSGLTPVRSRQSTTNSRNPASASVWPGQVDAQASPRRQTHAAASERRQRRLHHPAIDVRHQPVALRRAHEFAGCHRVSGLVLEPQQHLEAGAGQRRCAHRHDRLRIELEAILAQRRLQLLQPVDLAALARRRLVLRRVHLHVAALLLRHVAGGIRGPDHVLDRPALARHLDQPDAHADVEDLVLPHEAVVRHRAHDVVGDLPCLLERAAEQQDPELVAAQAADRVRVAHRILDQRGHLAQHAVARDVAAFVVDRLEAVQVQVAQDVANRGSVRGFDAPPAAGARTRGD